jgi:DNA transformation protein
MTRRDDDIAWNRELLAALGRIDARRMFGGTGFYADGRIVALEIEGVLYLKTDAETRARFADAGGRPFVYDNGRREVETSYWTPPDDALDSAEAMAPWARLARDAAVRAGAKAASKKTRATTSGRPANRPRRTSP